MTPCDASVSLTAIYVQHIGSGNLHHSKTPILGDFCKIVFTCTSYSLFHTRDSQSIHISERVKSYNRGPPPPNKKRTPYGVLFLFCFGMQWGESKPERVCAFRKRLIIVFSAYARRREPRALRSGRRGCKLCSAQFSPRLHHSVSRK